MKDKYVVVTGAYGFLGRHVARFFSENGYMVTGLGHGTWSHSEWQRWGLSEWHSCNITIDSLNAYVQQQPDVIVHCAGSGSVAGSLTHPMQDFERTVLTTLNLLEYLRLHSPTTALIYPSSAAVYGNAESLPILESFPRLPISPYGVHKMITEDLIRSYARQFSIPAAIVRYFSLYGSGLKKQLLWDTCRKIDKGDFEFYGTGNEIRDWLHIKDAVSLIFFLSYQDLQKPLIVNGGSGKGTTTQVIIKTILQKMNLSITPHFSGIPRPGDPLGYIADVTSTRKLGWKSNITIESGIDEYVQWYSSEIEKL
jgi:UDP-glucose 4-epimerase